MIKLPNRYWMMKLGMGNDEIWPKRAINFDTDESLSFGQPFMRWVDAVNKDITLNFWEEMPVNKKAWRHASKPKKTAIKQSSNLQQRGRRQRLNEEQVSYWPSQLTQSFASWFRTNK